MVSCLINILLPVNISFVFTVCIMDVVSIDNICCVDLIVVVTMMRRSMRRPLDSMVVSHLKVSIGRVSDKGLTKMNNCWTLDKPMASLSTWYLKLIKLLRHTSVPLVA